MSWSNLLSGLVGALIGGLLTLAASIMTMKQQRSLALEATAEDRRQAQLRASYAAGARILEDMLVIKEGLQLLLMRSMAYNPAKEATQKAAYDAVDRMFVVHNALIADDELRTRINALVNIINERWTSAYTSNADESKVELQSSAVLNYMEHVNKSIRAHLDNGPLPPAEPVPDLSTIDDTESAASETSYSAVTGEEDGSPPGEELAPA
jgi:hypothetical protein